MADDDYNEVDDLGYPLFLSVSYACIRFTLDFRGFIFLLKKL